MVSQATVAVGVPPSVHALPLPSHPLILISMATNGRYSEMGTASASRRPPPRSIALQIRDLTLESRQRIGIGGPRRGRHVAGEVTEALAAHCLDIGILTQEIRDRTLSHGFAVIAAPPSLPVRNIIGGGARHRREQVASIGEGQGGHDLPARDDRPLAADLDLCPEPDSPRIGCIDRRLEFPASRTDICPDPLGLERAQYLDRGRSNLDLVALGQLCHPAIVLCDHGFKPEERLDRDDVAAGPDLGIARSLHHATVPFPTMRQDRPLPRSSTSAQSA